MPKNYVFRMETDQNCLLMMSEKRVGLMRSLALNTKLFNEEQTKDNSAEVLLLGLYPC